MAYQTSMIKDLSIALEALTRVQSVGDEFERVKDLLKDAIKAQEKDNAKIYLAERTPTKTNPDDEIPF